MPFSGAAECNGGAAGSAGGEEEIGGGAWRSRRRRKPTAPWRLLGLRRPGDHEGEAARDGQDGAGPHVRAPLRQLPHDVAGAHPGRQAARRPPSRPGGAHGQENKLSLVGTDAITI